MERSRVLSLGFVAVIVVGVLALPGVVAGNQEELSLQEDVDPDLVNLNVAIEEDGTADWQIEYLVRLRTENETQGFEDLMADVEANRSDYIARFSDRMNATVASAENQTGRSMTATDFGVTADIRTLGNEYGVLTYTFTWTNFAQVTDDQVTAGDALAGFFLDAETTLQFTWPEEYQVASVTPDPTSTRETAVSWRGPLDFASGEPSLLIEPAPAVTTTTIDTTTTTPTTETTTTTSEESTSIWLWLLGGIGLLAILAGVWWYWREESGTGGGTQDGDGQGAETSAALMSNEERVEEYLSNQGGRAKQQEIVEGLGWTEAKTSQVLSEMQDSGRIEKFRIGRENVVKLPDTDSESG